MIKEGKLAIEKGGEATTIVVDNTDSEKVELEIKEGSSVGTLADLNDIVPDDISEKFNYVVDSNNTDDSIETIASSKGYIETNGKRKYYDDLQTAFNEGEGKTIVLTTDDFYNNVSITKFKVTNTTTLDLNGKILTARLTNTANVSLIKVAGGNLTIKDSTAPEHSYGTGSLIAEPAVYSDGWTVAVRVIAVERESTVEGTKSYLTIDSGKIIMKGAEGISNEANPYAIDILTNNYKDCDMVVTINGGYIESKSQSGMAVRLFANAMDSSANIIINGGEFIGDGRAIWLQQGQSHGEKNSVATSGFSKVNCTITAGSFKADRALAIADFNTNTTFNYGVKNIVVSISGGTFDSALSALGTDYIQSPSSDVVYLDGTSGWANQTEQHISISDTRN